MLKNTENYIQKTYKDPDDMVKTLQQMKTVSLIYPAKPKKSDTQYFNKKGDPDADVFGMAIFAWKENYKSVKLRMDKCEGSKSNALVLIYNQCSPELKNKHKGTQTQGYDTAKNTNEVAKLLTINC